MYKDPYNRPAIEYADIGGVDELLYVSLSATYVICKRGH